MRYTLWVEPVGRMRRRVMTTAIESGVAHIVMKGTGGRTRLGRVSRIGISRDGVVSLDGNEIGRYFEISDASQLPEVERVLASGAHAVVHALDWKVIPLENLVAVRQATGGRLIAVCGSADEARLFLEVMEHGVDGLLLRTGSPEAVTGVVRVMGSMQALHLELKDARIVSVGQAGMGDRVCVDTSTLMSHGEGILAGSHARCLFLVHSESLKSEYVAPRPFRVNAGAVHSYTLAGDLRTEYLSELRSGSSVMLVDAGGNARPVTVGRVKIERRPLLLVEAEAEKRSHTVLLQNAETVHLVSGTDPVSVVDLTPGDRVRVHLARDARHFGMAVRESIIEK